jgi:serine/threonine protein phosphatase PrpC
VIKKKAMARDAVTGIGMTWSASSHVGPRTENQDRAFVVERQHDGIAHRGVLLIVCDGVGGSQGGRQAAETAARVAHETYYSATGAGVRTWLNIAVATAHEHVRELGRASNQTSMATTIVMTVVSGGRLYTAHVGDSRAYLLRSGALQALTEDHSWVNEQRSRGIAVPNAHEMRSVITRSLGSAANNTPVVSDGVDLIPGDRVVLCSDGLHGAVSDEQAQTLLLQQPTSAAAATALVDAALQAKTRDNVTTAVLDYGNFGVVGMPAVPFRVPVFPVAVGLVTVFTLVVFAAVQLSAPSGDLAQGTPMPTQPSVWQRSAEPEVAVTAVSTAALTRSRELTLSVTPTEAVEIAGPTATLNPRRPAPTLRPTSRAPGAVIVPSSTPVRPTPTLPVVLPTESPTTMPTAVPQAQPMPQQPPTAAPTSVPTSAPTSVPTSAPTSAPTSVPTSAPPPTATPPPAGTIVVTPQP